ncbi:MAG: histidine kinase [Bacteroidota bacterium]
MTFHLLFWIGWAIFFNSITALELIQDIEIFDNAGGQIIDQTENKRVDALPLILVGILFKALLSYLILHRLTLFFEGHHWIKLVLSSMVLIAFFISIETFVDKNIIDASAVYEELHFDIWINSNYIQYLILVVVLIAYVVIERLIALDKKYLRMEKEKLQSELSFLKYQLNPHLLFNTLNNLFSMSQARGADDVSDGILKLSEIMRYMLYENKESLIPLKKEVDFLHQYMELQKLRFEEEELLQFSFKIEGDLDQIKIPPFILIPFVENACKHGINTNAPSTIDILLVIENNTLTFKVANSIVKGQKKLSADEGGIGIRNLKQRLELLYPNAYVLKHYESNETYYSMLEIVSSK